MKWLFRLGSLVGVSLLLGLGTGGCVGTGDVGNSCPLTLDASKENLKQLDREARIIEPSFDCEFTYCIANYYDADNPDTGYCTRTCEAVSDCPNDTEYVCEAYVQVEKLPKEFSSLSGLVGEKLCLKIPPQQANQANQ